MLHLQTSVFATAEMVRRESSPGHHALMVEMLIISEVRGVRHLYVAVLFVCASGLMTDCWCC